MKRVFSPLRVLAACLLFGLAAGGIWTLRHPRASASSPATVAAADPLAALPPAIGSAPVDREIARWEQRAREQATSSAVWTHLGDALMQKARETADLSYYGHAERAYRQALALHPADSAAMTGMAWVTGCRHAFEQSVEWAGKALALDPRNSLAYGLLGDADIEMGDYDAAFRHYQQMLDIRPDIASYSRGAHLLYLTGDVRRAGLLMAKAIRVGAPFAENTAWCRAQLATIYFNDGDLWAAERVLQDALRRTPGNYHALLAMSRVKTARKDYAGAIACLRRAVAVAPQHDAVAALEELYRLTGRRAEAAQQDATVEAIHRLQKAGGVQGDMLLARYYADRDSHLPEALQMAESEYKTRRNVFAADTLAWCLYKNGRYAEARAMSRQALRLNTPDAAMLFHAGMIAARCGESEQAKQYLSRALFLNPGFSPTFARVAANTLRALGSVRQARAATGASTR